MGTTFFWISTTAGPLIVELCTACLLAAATVAMSIRVCRKRGWVAKPRPDRWHKGTPAKFGGVAICLVVIASSAWVIRSSDHSIWGILVLASLMSVLGLIDDIFRLRPGPKLIAQFCVVAPTLALGVGFSVPGHPFLSACLSLCWIVGISNAFNLLDNMDGLSAGVSSITAIYLAVPYLLGGLMDYGSLLFIVAGASAGFVIFNFRPARIFMGDSGSLFLGFLLGAISLVQIRKVPGIRALALTPVLVLSIPILDTFLVSVTRRLRGQPVSVGGTDHSSHRLVRMGLNERDAVMLLYLVTVASGTVAMGGQFLAYPRALGLMLLWLFLLLLFGIHLFHTETGHDSHAPTSPFLKRLLHPDSLAFLLDPIILSLSYYLAYFLRFEATVPRNDFDAFLRSWPIVVMAKCGAMWLSGLYGRSWWRAMDGDAFRLAVSGFIGEVFAVLVLFGLYKFTGYSRIVFMVDFAAAWALLVVLRKSFQLFRKSMRRLESPDSLKARRAFLLGTSEQTELALLFLRAQKIECAGLIDTNGGSDLRRNLWGVRVVGQVRDLPRLAVAHHVSEVILPDNESMPCSEMEFINSCTRERLQVSRLGLHSLNRTPN
jgi:UDP-GlcNAc:undecaprenyl-phosphate GlcNAc-1-phosphate transferase